MGWSATASRMVIGMWVPANEDELRSALGSGDLRESHSYEFKRELGMTSGARAETARDLASLMIDGGVLIVGVDEDKEDRSFTLAPVALRGQIEALEQIAALRIDPRATIHATEIESGGGDGTGYLVGVVPPSASAPHMVQGVYYGRGERTRERLTDAQVMRYQRIRSADGERAESALLEIEAADPVPPEQANNGHLYLVAVPVSAPPRVAEDLAWTSADVLEVLRGAEAKLPDVLLEADPSPYSLRWPVRRQHGTSWTSLNPNHTDWTIDEDGAMSAEIRDDGSIHVFVGRLTDLWERRPGRGEELLLIDALLIANAYRILFWAAELGRRIGYAGAWDIGISGNGMLGASSAAIETRPSHMLPIERTSFPAAEFRELARATAWDIAHQPGAIVDRLVGRVLRAVGTTDEMRSLGTQLPDSRYLRAPPSKRRLRSGTPSTAAPAKQFLGKRLQVHCIRARSPSRFNGREALQSPLSSPHREAERGAVLHHLDHPTTLPIAARDRRARRWAVGSS